MPISFTFVNLIFIAKSIHRLGWVTIRLTALPGIVEAFTVSAAAVGIFEMSFSMGLSLGFILAAVSPAVVVVGMFGEYRIIMKNLFYFLHYADLQRRGYGIEKGMMDLLNVLILYLLLLNLMIFEKGIPSLVVAAASFDDVVAISGFSLVIGFAVTSGTTSFDNLHDVIHMLHGVINIFGGAFIGLLGILNSMLLLLYVKLIVIIFRRPFMFMDENLEYFSEANFSFSWMGINEYVHVSDLKADSFTSYI